MGVENSTRLYSRIITYEGVRNSSLVESKLHTGGFIPQEDIRSIHLSIEEIVLQLLNPFPKFAEYYFSYLDERQLKLQYIDDPNLTKAILNREKIDTFWYVAYNLKWLTYRSHGKRVRPIFREDAKYLSTIIYDTVLKPYLVNKRLPKRLQNQIIPKISESIEQYLSAIDTLMYFEREPKSSSYIESLYDSYFSSNYVSYDRRIQDK